MRLPHIRTLATVSAILLVAAAMDGLSHVLLAQNPFGGTPRSGLDPQTSGVVGWLLRKQSEFYQEISSTIRAAKTSGSAVWSLLAISFLYGIFHAAGPGHGKAVISSYLVANGETARLGIMLSFASALMQSLVAMMIVGVGAWILNVTARSLCGAERVIEIASYGFIAVFGARLAWTKGWALIRVLRISRVSTVTPAPAFAYASLEGYNAAEHGRTETRFLHAAMSAESGILMNKTIASRGSRTFTTNIVGIRTVPSRATWRDPAAGDAGSALFLPSVCDPVRCTPGVGIRSRPRSVLGGHSRHFRNGIGDCNHGCDDRHYLGLCQECGGSSDDKT